MCAKSTTRYIIEKSFLDIEKYLILLLRVRSGVQGLQAEAIPVTQPKMTKH